MKVRFQADADFNQNIVRAVRRRVPAVDFQAAREAGLQGLGDEAVLEQAARDGRILVSHDRRTMPIHFANFTATRTSAGVILISQNLPIIQAVEDLILIWEASEAEEWVNRLDSLPL
jgi:predicted nuclease of predicted toxin-antitoxin system